MANSNRKLAFITGATGFIGSRVAERLCRENWDVRALVRSIAKASAILEVSREAESLERFVFVSAFMAGGFAQPLPAKLTEETTGVEFPDSYYQWKRKGEKIVAKMIADPVSPTPLSGRYLFAGQTQIGSPPCCR